jgi:hypothetical protein
MRCFHASAVACFIIGLACLAGCSRTNPNPGDIGFAVNADDSVSLASETDRLVTGDEMTQALTAAMEQYQAVEQEKQPAPDGQRTEHENMAANSAPGPQVTIVADPDATYGALDGLLHTCVDCGYRLFLLKPTTDDTGFAFDLEPPPPPSEWAGPDNGGLPPIMVRLRATEDGHLRKIWANQRQPADLAAVQKWIIDILGDDRGPRSIQASARVEMHCDAHLKMRNVFEAMQAVSGYTAQDGSRIELISKIRPVDWGSGHLPDKYMDE